jgi:hypothetical protein
MSRNPWEDTGKYFQYLSPSTVISEESCSHAVRARSRSFIVSAWSLNGLIGYFPSSDHDDEIQQGVEKAVHGD